jgi:hypothetical protein
LINVEEAKKNLENRKNKLIEEINNRKKEIESEGIKNFEYYLIHKRKNMMVFSKGSVEINIFKVVLKLLKYIINLYY